MAKAVADEYLRRIPKAELHCHLAGTLRATTVAELAQCAGLALPRPADKLYQWPDFYGFLNVLRLTALVLRTPGDFARAVYEYVEDAVHDGNLKHVEFFFNPDYFYPNGIDYPAMVDGMIEGIAAAEKKFGVSSLLICCIDRSTNTRRRLSRSSRRQSPTGGIMWWASASTAPSVPDRPRPSPRPMRWPTRPACIAPRIAAR